VTTLRGDSPGAPGVSGGLKPRQRLPLLILGFVGLALGVAAGLARLGFRVPTAAASLAALHGPLMICAFFGVVICLERAVAIGRLWAYLGPAFAGAGCIAIIAHEVLLASLLFVAASTVLLAGSLAIFRRQRALFTATMALGALCWVVGNVAWGVGANVHDSVAWWLGFLILTIAGERLELSRFLMPSPVAQRAFVAIIIVICAGLAGASFPWGAAVFAAGMLALAAWLGRQDIARRTVRGVGLTRFIAVCLLGGYLWLAAGAIVVLVAGGFAPGTRAYDAALHMWTLGFVFAMVFGHAPIIFPAVLRVAVPYHAMFYVPLALLHLSVLVRVVGDAIGIFGWIRTGGLLGAIALAAFIVSTAGAVVRGRR
jgi:hypothetical protein